MMAGLVITEGIRGAVLAIGSKDNNNHSKSFPHSLIISLRNVRVSNFEDMEFLWKTIC